MFSVVTKKGLIMDDSETTDSSICSFYRVTNVLTKEDMAILSSRIDFQEEGYIEVKTDDDRFFLYVHPETKKTFRLYMDGRIAEVGQNGKNS
jgi:hypothetical protein